MIFFNTIRKVENMASKKKDDDKTEDVEIIDNVQYIYW